MKPPPARHRPTTRPGPVGSGSAVSSARGGGLDPSEPRLRMRDLVRETGVPRETIHFYKLQGLLPPPLKTGRNTALYTQQHVERLRRIRELQERQFLPLKAIRAVLEDTEEEGFTPEQEDLVRRVRGSLAGWTRAQQHPAVSVADFVPERVSPQELRELRDAGLIHVHGQGGKARVSEDDAVILECWAQFKEAGFGPRQGIGPSELSLYDEAMERLVKREARLALESFREAGAKELSRVVELTGPVIGRLLVALHRKRLRQFLAESGGAPRPPST